MASSEQLILPPAILTLAITLLRLVGEIALQFPIWKRFFHLILAYGYAARIPVAIIMPVATWRGWAKPLTAPVQPGDSRRRPGCFSDLSHKWSGGYRSRSFLGRCAGLLRQR